MTSADIPDHADVPTPAEVFPAHADEVALPMAAPAPDQRDEPATSTPTAPAGDAAKPAAATKKTTAPRKKAAAAPTKSAPPEVVAKPLTPKPAESGPATELADRVASAALAVAGVADLHSGTFGEVATYLPGRRVDGVRITDSVTEVHLVLQWGSPVIETADAVRLAVQPLVGTPVDIAVQDVVDPSAASPEPSHPTKEIS